MNNYWHVWRKGSNFALMIATRLQVICAKLLALCAITLLASAVACASGTNAALACLATCSGELSSHDGPQAVTDDHGLMIGAPAQVPMVMPHQGSRLLGPGKYRTASSRVVTARRYLVKSSGTLAEQVAVNHGYLLERISSPLRSRGALHFHVIELCRLLC